MGRREGRRRSGGGRRRRGIRLFLFLVPTKVVFICPDFLKSERHDRSHASESRKHCWKWWWMWMNWEGVCLCSTTRRGDELDLERRGALPSDKPPPCPRAMPGICRFPSVPVYCLPLCALWNGPL